MVLENDNNNYREDNEKAAFDGKIQPDSGIPLISDYLDVVHERKKVKASNTG